MQDEENKINLDFDLEIPQPEPEAFKPKIRSVNKPSRPCTPMVNHEPRSIQPIPKATGKISRRLRSLVLDHKDTPV